MGVGLYLTGTFPSEIGDTSIAAEWLARVAAWLEGHEEEPLMVCQQGQNSSDHPTLFVQIHPCAEDVEISVPDAGLCLVSAKTSTAGPGYHIFLCELLHELGAAFQIEWDTPAEEIEADETGYFFRRDAGAVRAEMLRWLSAVSGIVLENCPEGGDEGVRMVSMPLDRSYPDQEGIVTPTGPRSRAWFAARIDAPEDGIDFFPWWPEGVGSAFFLGRSLCRLWQDVRWRTPATEAEADLLVSVHRDLERAYHLDPGAAIPWREWSELLDYVDDHFGYVEFEREELNEDEILRRADLMDPAAPEIGYRRGRVSVTLTGGWSLTIPGSFSEEWQEGGETWSAWHGGRTIWFTSWSVSGEADRKPSAREILDGRSWPDEGTILEHQDGNLVGQAVFLPYEEEGEPLWNLKAYSAIEGNFCLCNIYVKDESDRDWAIEIWKSLRN
jgi:hypothetical protein